MISQEFNSLNYLLSIRESIENVHTPIDCSLEFTSLMANVSITSLISGAIIVPALAVYELVMSIFNGIMSLLIRDRDLKIRALDHTITFLELPCISLQFILTAFIPCQLLSHECDQKRNCPKEKKTIRNISVAVEEISEMRDFLDRSLNSSNISRLNLLALHESLK